LIEGTLEISQVENSESTEIRMDTVGQNSVVYHPANQVHTMRNVGNDTAKYYVLKWLGEPSGHGEDTKPGLWQECQEELPGKTTYSRNGMRFTSIYSSRTPYLSRLHIHFDTFEPGQGYSAHSDSYDIFLFVSCGQVRINQRTVIDGGFYYHPATQQHELKNTGYGIAKILVIEIHGIGRGLEFDVKKIQALKEWELLASRSSIEIAQSVPAGSSIILIDDNQIGKEYFKGFTVSPFIEHEGHYWGPPPFDETAIDELERMRSGGAQFLVFCWPSFWWLDYYKQFKNYIDQTYIQKSSTNSTIIYDITRKT
jgi:hypothetical protein